MKYLVAAAALALALPGAASALSFSGSWDVSGSALTDPGLVVRTDPTSNHFAFDLDDGRSKSLNLFRIWTDETSIQADDKVPNDLSVGFSVNGANGPLTGSVAGHSQWFSIFNTQFGSLTFGGPIDLDVGTGILSVALKGVDEFNKGLYGLKKGEKYGGEVSADFSYRENSPAPVPLPAGLGLIVAGLGALGFFGARRPA